LRPRCITIAHSDKTVERKNKDATVGRAPYLGKGAGTPLKLPRHLGANVRSQESLRVHFSIQMQMNQRVCAPRHLCKTLDQRCLAAPRGSCRPGGRVHIIIIASCAIDHGWKVVLISIYVRMYVCIYIYICLCKGVQTIIHLHLHISSLTLEKYPRLN
jgi:hypothetical protein